MTDYLNFHPSLLSDEELLNKKMEIAKKMVMAERFGSSDLIYHLQEIMQSIETVEIERRVSAAMKTRDNRFPDVIETEPDLVDNTEKQKVQKDKKERKKIIGIQRTSRPINEMKNDD